MSDYPAIQNLTGLEIKESKPANRQTSAAGYTISTARATTAKKEFVLNYTAMPPADKTTLKDFFDANQGKSFTLSSPDPDEVKDYTVIFNQDEVSFSAETQLPGKWRTDVNLKEV